MSDPSPLIDAASDALAVLTQARERYQRTEDPADLALIPRLDIAYIGALSTAIDAHLANGRSDDHEAQIRALPNGEAILIARTADPETTALFAGERRHPLTDYIVDWAEFWSTEDQEREWLIEPLFAAGRAHAIYAGAKTGKSYTVLAACAAAATGAPFLGHKPPRPLKVLYVDYEMTADDIRDRLTEFGYGPDDDLSGLSYALLPSLPPLDTAAGGSALLSSAMALEVDLVVIDTTGRALQGDENDADAVRDYFRHTGSRLKQAGITAVRLDHAGKDPERGQRGSSAKNDDVDVVWQITRTDDGQVWKATHRRMSWVPESVPIVVAANESGVSTFATTGTTWPAGTKDCAAEMDRLGLPSDVSTRTATTVLRSSGISMSNNTIRAAVRYRREMAENDLIGADGPRPANSGRASTNAPESDIGARSGRARENPIKPRRARSGRAGRGTPSTPRPDSRVPERGADQGQSRPDDDDLDENDPLSPPPNPVDDPTPRWL